MNRLLSLPLFLGMSHADLQQAVDELALTIQTCAKGRVIAAEGERCDRLIFLLEGEIEAEAKPYDNGYIIAERLTAPDVLQIERLFGLTQLYTRTFRTHSRCQLIYLDKADIMATAQRYVVFRLNLLNAICTQAQKNERRTWSSQPDNIRAKLLRFITDRCLRPAGHKEIKITMQRLAHELSESRLNVSRTLNTMAANDEISLTRSQITIPALERLIGR